MAREYNGVIITVEPRKAEAEKMAIKGGEDPDVLHITMAYISQDVDELDEDRLVEVRKKLKEFATDVSPLEGEITAISQFTGGDEPAWVLLVDAPGLSKLRADMLAALDIQDDGEHDFLPHITIQYGGKEPKWEKYKVHFDHLVLRVADDPEKFKMGPKWKATDFNKGLKEETKEHGDTLKRLEENDINVDEALKEIVDAHLEMDPEYYAKESNILDPVHDKLDQEVFDGSKPRMEFFEYHLHHIREVFRQNGFNPHGFNFYLTGSLCTYQYSEDSDVDISIVSKLPMSEEDRADLIGISVSELDGSFFPRTRHKYQHFVQPDGVDIMDLFHLGLRAAWDFQKNDWISSPDAIKKHNVFKEKPDWVSKAIMISDKINTLIDRGHYEDAITAYKDVHQRRKEDQVRHGDYSEGNIIYKYLNNNGTFDRLRYIGQRIA